MRWRTRLFAFCCALGLLLSSRAGAEEASVRARSPSVFGDGVTYLAELGCGLSFRSDLPAELGGLEPGAFLRTDFGRHLGAGFYLLGTLAWSQQAASGDLEACEGPDCPDMRASKVDSLLFGLSVRYALRFEAWEIFAQAGLGGMLDLVDGQALGSDERRMSLDARAVFMGSLGFDIFLGDAFFAGLRSDGVMSVEIYASNLLVFGGTRF
ncbi:MAG: hypothetical protein JXR96_31225 [Deltaproteobacteria bacterium]|nr:hypothetical protein [Deltaproteobacteria bacterium]